MIVRLVVKEFVVEEGEEGLDVGEKYSYFYDPETGKFYRPTESFEVKGEYLETLFEEVECA